MMIDDYDIDVAEDLLLTRGKKYNFSSGYDAEPQQKKELVFVLLGTATFMIMLKMLFSHVLPMIIMIRTIFKKKGYYDAKVVDNKLN